MFLLKEILCNDMELANTFEDETIDYEDGTVEKGCVELVSSADVNVNPTNAGVGSDDDDDDDNDEDEDGEVNYFDDDLSE